MLLHTYQRNSKVKVRVVKQSLTETRKTSFSEKKINKKEIMERCEHRGRFPGGGEIYGMVRQNEP